MLQTIGLEASVKDLDGTTTVLSGWQFKQSKISSHRRYAPTHVKDHDHTRASITFTTLMKSPIYLNHFAKVPKMCSLQAAIGLLPASSVPNGFLPSQLTYPLFKINFESMIFPNFPLTVGLPVKVRSGRRQ